MKKKIIIGSFIVLLFFLIFFLIPYKDSPTIAGFPVPRFAELTNVSEYDLYEEYHWSSASEKNGLPLLYLLMIKLKGWKAVEQMGALTIYEKNERKIDVISQTNFLSIRVLK